MKLYEIQSYVKEIQTRITACQNIDGKVWIQLEDSIFFPEEGGQYADTGTLTCEGRCIHLLDGQVKNGEVWYLIDQELEVGSEVFCQMDWETRYMRMQQHSGEHILTGVIHNAFGYNNTGFHLSDDAPVILDLDGTLTGEQITAMEMAANEVIYANLPIIDTYPEKEALETISYRSKIEIEGQVRLIIIGHPELPVDVCACCAPHVAHTGEVGLIKVISAQNYKGGTRLHILCGKRAIQYFQSENQIMSQLSKMFSTSMDKVIGCVEGQMQEAADLKYKLALVTEKGLVDQIQNMEQSTHACMVVDAEVSPVTAKNCFNTMTEKFPGYVGIFIGNDKDGYRFQAGSRSLDSRELMQKMKEKLGAKGGGSPQMAQGKTNANQLEIEAFFQNLDR